MNILKVLFLMGILGLIQFSSSACHRTFFKGNTNKPGSIPSKEHMIRDLRLLSELLDSQLYQEPIPYFTPLRIFEGKITESDIIDFTSSDDLTLEGISELEQHGKFGKLFEVFPERGEVFLRKTYYESSEHCYALNFESAEVAGKWDGSKFIFFRLDDIR